MRNSLKNSLKKSAINSYQQTWLNDLEQSVISGDIKLTKRHLKSNQSFRFLPYINHARPLLSCWKLHQKTIRLDQKSQYRALHEVLLKHPELQCTLAKLAVIKGEITAIHYLLQFNMDINQIFFEGNTLLHLAVKSKQYEIVDLLLSYGSDVTIKNDENLTALDLSIMSKQKQIAFLLLDHTTDCHKHTIVLSIYSDWYDVLVQILKLDSELIAYALKHTIIANKTQALFLIVNKFQVSIPLKQLRSDLKNFIQPQCYHILKSHSSLINEVYQ